MGPSAYTRVAEIMSGRTIGQQGRAAICEDPAYNGTTGGAGRAMVWRMSPYERRRRGNALPGGLRGCPDGGNSPAGQRGSGHSVATVTEAQPDAELDILRPGFRGEGAKQTPRCRGERCARTVASRHGGRLALINGVQSRGQNRTREIRPSGIAGRLQETWPMVELGTHPATERADVETLHLSARAPELYPDICMLRARWRGLETEPRTSLHGHEGGNPGHSQGMPYGPPRQPSTLLRTS